MVDTRDLRNVQLGAIAHNLSAWARNPYVESPKFGGNPYVEACTLTLPICRKGWLAR